MLVLVTGGSGSGKSEFAEDYCMQTAKGEMIYLATMKNDGPESEQRIRKHRANRAGKGFVTQERSTHPERISCKKGDLVLLECLSNLVAGTMFEDWKQPLDVQTTVSRLTYELDALFEMCEDVVIVTNQVFSDGIVYDQMTHNYMEALARINAYAARCADEVYEVVYGIPVRLS